MKKKQIFITDLAYLAHNYGAQAIALPLMEKLKERFEARFVFAFPEKFYTKENIEFVQSLDAQLIVNPNPIAVLAKNSNFFKILHFFRKNILRFRNPQLLVKEKKYLDKFFKTVSQSDLVLDANGIEFGEYPKFRKTLADFLFSIYIQDYAQKIAKPYIKYTKSYGPFLSFWYRDLVRTKLNRLPFVLVRQGENLQNIKNLALDVPVFEFADVSLILKPASPLWAKKYLQDKGLNLGRPIIGISPSVVIANLQTAKAAGQNHLELVNKIISGYQKNYQILLLPHSIGNGENARSCDLALSRKIYQDLQNKKNVYLLEEDTLTYAQVRSIIGLLDFYITGRFHAVSSSLCMGVPTVPLAWHVKYQDLMALFLDKYPLINSRKLNISQAFKVIDKHFRNRDWFDRKKVLTRRAEIAKKIDQSIQMIVDQIS